MRFSQGLGGYIRLNPRIIYVRGNPDDFVDRPDPLSDSERQQHLMRPLEEELKREFRGRNLGS